MAAASREAARATPESFSRRSSERSAAARASSGRSSRAPGLQGGVVLQQAEDGKGLPAGQAAQVQLGEARGAVVLGADVDEAGAFANGLLAGDVHREALLVEGRVDHQQGLGVADVRVGGRGHHVRGLQLAVDEVGQRGHVVRAQGQPGQLLGEVDLLVGQAGRDEHRHLVAAVAAGQLLEPHGGVAEGLVEARLLQLAPDAQQGPAQALGRLHVAVAEAALVAVVAVGASSAVREICTRVAP